MAVAAMTAQAAIYIKGDVNRDGDVDIADVNAIVNVIMDQGDSGKADVNDDGVVDVADVNQVINIILSGEREVVRTNVDYVWNMDKLPEIHIEVPLDEWNRLLVLYDANSQTKQYIVANVRFVIDGEETVIEEAGLRLKGNTSRRRPEGNYMEMHKTKNTDWNHVHFGLNLRKWVKDDEHTIKGVRKLHLKYFKEDPAYVRELFCYNLMRDAGVWTAPRANYCRLWLKVEGDAQETYYGIYDMLEPIDENYLKRRDSDTEFGGNDGFLWKCRYPASLTNPYSADYGVDDTSDNNHTYKLETRIEDFEAAKAQLIDFQLKLNGKGDESFAKWIKEVCDVDLLLRTYAAIVAVGHWDDYLCNSNNYYIYFTTDHITDYKFYMIPYDLDNTLGTSHMNRDYGRQDPFDWGPISNPRISRIVSIPEYREKYIKYMQEIVDDDSDLMHFNDAVPRIRAWHDKISNYVSNDTGEDMQIIDRPASWGNHSEYRLLEDGFSTNWFRVKKTAIDAVK